MHKFENKDINSIWHELKLMNNKTDDDKTAMFFKDNGIKIMTLDIKMYLQQIPEADWKLGNNSKYALSGNYFFKRLKAKAPSKVHDFLLNTKLSSTINSFVARFEDYCNLSDSDCQYLKYKGENAKYNHVYVFEKVNFEKLDYYFGSKNIKEYMRVLDDLNHFFNALNIAGITYHDVCWDNIVWNKTTNKLCVIDLDNMVESADTYESLIVLGSPLFHVSFFKFSEKYATTRSLLHDIKFLNLCIYHNMFFAFVLGFSQNDKRFNQMNYSSSVNAFVTKYVEGDYIDTLENENTKCYSYITIDKEFANVLKKATDVVSSYIEGNYSGNPFAYMASLANELAHEIPAKPEQHKPVQFPVQPKPVSPPPIYKSEKSDKSFTGPKPHSNRIFVVHGHDDGMKEAVARTLEKVGLQPIILQEQANCGNTIIEKFEACSENVTFAVVLISPDDKGYAKDQEVESVNYRARQNVIMELGYFMGKLGRKNVVALYKNERNFELPSDFSGVLFTLFDSNNGWKLALAKELYTAGYDIDLKKLLL